MTADVYFAYGSNMLRSQMTARCPDSVLVGSARLPAHRVAFSRYSSKRSSWTADLVQASDADVWGVLYALTPADLASLDRHEGHPNAYRRRRIDVLRHDGALAAVWTYLVVNPESGQRPSFAYWHTLVDGAREHGLPPSYVALLETLDHEPALGS